MSGRLGRKLAMNTGSGSGTGRRVLDLVVIDSPKAVAGGPAVVQS